MVGSAAISTTGSRSSRSTCRRCASGSAISRTLIAMFLERAGSPASERARTLAQQVGGAALERLQRYHWPGNVRELRNVITRAVALAGPDDDFQSLPFVLRPIAAAPEIETARADRPFHEAKDEVIAQFEREYLSDLVQRAERQPVAGRADRWPRAQVPLQAARARRTDVREEEP